MTENWTQNQGMQNPQGQTYAYYRTNKLYRSTRDKWIAGVCGGIAEHYNQDPLLIRILWIALTLLSAGVGIFLYLALWLLVEKYPSYYVPPPQTPNVDSVHYHYHYKPSDQNKKVE